MNYVIDSRDIWLFMFGKFKNKLFVLFLKKKENHLAFS